MKYIQLYFLFLLCCLFAKAQEPGFSWSGAERKPSVNVNVKVIGYDKQGFCILTKKPATATEISPEYFVDFFSNANQRISSVNITPSATYDYVEVLFVNGKVYLFTSFFSKEVAKNILYAAEIKPDGSKEDPFEIASITADKLASRGRFKAAASPDGLKLLVMAEPDLIKNENEKVELSLFTSGFEKLWSAMQTFPYEWKRGVDNKPFVNNEGTAFILKRTGNKNYAPVYSVFSFNGKDLKEFKIETGEKQKVISIYNTFSPGGDFVVTGYYSETGNVSVTVGIPVHGSYIYRIENSGSSLSAGRVNPFNIKRKDIVLKNILFQGNNIILLSEHYWTTSTGTTNSSNPFNTSVNAPVDNTYYGKEIWLDGFDETAKSLYSINIDKDNTSKNDNGAGVSYFGVLVNDKIALIFNDYGYKYDGKKHVVVAAPAKIPVLTYLDPQNGKTIKTTGLFNDGGIGGKAGDMLIRPDVFFKIDETHYIIRAENILNYKMGILSF